MEELFIRNGEKFRAALVREAEACAKRYIDTFVRAEARQQMPFGTKIDHCVDDENCQPDVEQLAFLLDFCAVTGEKHLLKRVVEFSEINFQLTNGQMPQPGWERVYIKLFQLTLRSDFLSGALSCFQKELTLADDSCRADQITVRHINHLLDLYRFSGSKNILDQLNSAIIKLFRRAYYTKAGISWLFLSGMPVRRRIFAERELRLTFLRLFQFLGNPVFFQASDQLTKTNRRLAQAVPFPESGITPEYLAFMRVEIRLQLRELDAGQLKTTELQCAKLAKDIARGFNLSKKSPKKRTVLPALICAIVHYEAFCLNAEDNYYQAALEQLYLFVEQGGITLGEMNATDFRPSSLKYLLWQIMVKATDESCIATGPTLMARLPRDLKNRYPAFSLTEEELRLLIISNWFPKTMVLLRDRLCNESSSFFKQPMAPGEVVSLFSNFVKTAVQAHKDLSTFLGPVFRLETAGYLMLLRPLTARKGCLDFGNQTEVLAQKQYLALNLITAGRYAVADIYINAVLKCRAFVFGNYLNPGVNKILVRYNNLLCEPEECIVDDLDVMVLRAFKKGNTVNDGLNLILKNIANDDMPAARAGTLIVERIKHLEAEMLLINDN